MKMKNHPNKGLEIRAVIKVEDKSHGKVPNPNIMINISYPNYRLLFLILFFVKKCKRLIILLNKRQI